MSRHVKTEQDLRRLALDIVEGKVFGSWDCRSDGEVRSSFMVLMLAGPEVVEQMKDVVHVYEYMDKAGPMAVNGRPIFFSCGTLTRDEADRLQPLIEQAQEYRNAFMGNSGERAPAHVEGEDEDP